jgi:NADH-quinone oxidoreductase subunit G
MAAVTDVQTVNITINGSAFVVPKGEMIVEAIKRIGVDIPIFCYHPRMKPVGMCRMCLVEMGSKGPDGSIRMMPKPQTACSLPATEGLVILTDTDKIHQDRKGVLEFLLINHPLDCPICDRGGECPLQNNTLYYGPSTSRFIEAKRHAPKAFPLSRYVTLDLERCIQCGRCVRFTEEISGDAQLAFRFRGASMQPSTFELRDFSSKFSGNVIEICPVGALTNTTYRFRARPWDLETRPAICTNCGNGCNIFIDYRNRTLVRVNARTNEHVNEEWTCDRGKFGHEYYNSDRRLSLVLARDETKLAPSNWSDAYSQIIKKFSGGNGAILGGASNSNEDIFSIANLFKQQFGTSWISFFGGLDAPATFPTDAKPTRIEEFEGKKSILVFASSLADDQPILYLRVRKASVLNGANIVVAHSQNTDVDGFAASVLRYRPGSAHAVAAALAKAIADPDVELGDIESETGVESAKIREAAAILRIDGCSVVTSQSVLNLERSGEVLESLSSIAATTVGTFDVYPSVSNGAFAAIVSRRMNLVPHVTTRAILEGCLAGTIKALWVVGEELLDFPDQDLLRRALESVEFLVVQDVMETELTSYASLVLPMTAPAEADGTWTNIEHRVQRMTRVLPVHEESKPLWLVATELRMSLDPALLPYSAAEVMNVISATLPEFAGVDYGSIPESGLVLA